MYRFLGIYSLIFCLGACDGLLCATQSAQRKSFVFALSFAMIPALVTLLLRLTRSTALRTRWRRVQRRATIVAVAAAIVFGMGLGYTALRMRTVQLDDAALAGRASGTGTELLVGRIDGAVERGASRLSSPFLVEGWYGPAGFVRTGAIRLWLTISTGTARQGPPRDATSQRFHMRFYAEASDIGAGDYIAVYVHLRRAPDGPFAVALLRRGIRWLAAGSIYGVNRVAAPERGWGAAAEQGAVQDWIARRAGVVYGNAAAAWILAFAVGDRQGIPSTLLKTMAALGFVHAVVASGATVRLTVDPPVRFVRKRSGRRRLPWVATGVAMIAALLLLAGLVPPAVRAATVYLYDLAAKALGKKGDRLTANAAAAVVLVLLQPTSLLDPGVWLSYTAVATLSYLPRRLEAHAFGWLRPAALRRVVARGTAAELGVTPLAMSMFGQFSVLSIIVNIVLYPVLEWVTPLSFSLVAAAVVVPVEAGAARPLLAPVAHSVAAVIGDVGQLPLVMKIPQHAYAGLLAYDVLLISFVRGIEGFKQARNGLYSDKSKSRVPVVSRSPGKRRASG